MSRGRVAPAGPPAGAPGDDTGCTVLHVDMDAFYASVEVRRRPELRGLPVIVGGTGSRGVVTAATYEARAYGVHSAMPMTRARRLCPDAIVVPPDFDAYAATSRAVMEVFRSVTPLVEPISLDEAFLDVAGAVRRLGPPARIGELIRARILDEQRITCSVGVASTKFVAKLASARCKPDGLLVVPHGDVLAFLHPLPVAALWGVGERTEEVLLRLGLRTVGDIARAPLAALQDALGPAAGGHLHALSWGRDERSVVPHEPDKSIGAEETFARDIGDPGAIHRELLRLSERTAARLRAGGHAGRTVSIKVRFADFTTVTRARTLPAATDVGQVIYATARALYDAMGIAGRPLRLVGVRVEQLATAGAQPEQLELGAAPTGWREAEQAVDRAVRRFGTGAVRPATLVRPGDDPSAPPSAAPGELRPGR
ncbi:MAG TPA: DNA polymerase IV [Mycobacteriales bacterium]|nr:DNA polymerase IV [Mycobacteriales bacterium]